MDRGTRVFWSSIGLVILGATASCTITATLDADAGAGGASAGNGGSGGTAGAGGAVGTGSSAGAGGTSGGAADDAAAVIGTGSDPCALADPGNEDRDHATPYALGAELRACLHSKTDLDFYEFMTPATPVGGGVVVVNLTEVGTGGGLESVSFATSDNGRIAGNFEAEGTSVYYWFGVVPATRYRVLVGWRAGNMATPYTLRATFLGVEDTYEPNDTRAQAKTIALGTPVHGFMFAGFSSSVDPAGGAAWQDWFKVTLAAGSATFRLADVPTEFTGIVTVWDSNGAAVGGRVMGASDGATVTAMHTGLTAGDYSISIESFVPLHPEGVGSTPPHYATQAYTFTVTQP